MTFTFQKFYLQIVMTVQPDLRPVKRQSRSFEPQIVNIYANPCYLAAIDTNDDRPDLLLFQICYFLRQKTLYSRDLYDSINSDHIKRLLLYFIWKSGDIYRQSLVKKPTRKYSK